MKPEWTVGDVSTADYIDRCHPVQGSFGSLARMRFCIGEAVGVLDEGNFGVVASYIVTRQSIVQYVLGDGRVKEAPQLSRVILTQSNKAA